MMVSRAYKRRSSQQIVNPVPIQSRYLRGVYPISGTAGEDGAQSGDHDATNQVGTLIIKGAGPSQTIIDGNELDRVFDLHPGTRTVIEDMTIRGGLLASVNRGGGVRHVGDHLLVRNVVFTEKNAFSGGGLINDGGDVELVDVTFRENEGLLGAGMHQWIGSAKPVPNSNGSSSLHATLIRSSWPAGDATMRVWNYELLRNGRVTPSFFRLRIDPPVSE